MSTRDSASTVIDSRPSVRILSLLTSPIWLAGTGLLGLAIVIQLVSLYLAPLTVVQPLGATALILTTLINARSTRHRVTSATVRDIALCIGGIGAFVTVATVTTSSRPIVGSQLLTILIILVAILTSIGSVLAFRKRQISPLLLILFAGIVFGFVATMAKVVIDRLKTIVSAGIHTSATDFLTLGCLVGVVVAACVGSYLVQLANASGPTDLVIAGLTVIDPIVGVTIGIVVLNEAEGAPWWAPICFLGAGAVAIYGVWHLSRSRVKPVESS